jgi:hypothetical protein
MAAEFATLTAHERKLVRRIGEETDGTHCLDIEVVNEKYPKSWLSLEDKGWIRIDDRSVLLGYGRVTLRYTLDGWEWWCLQVDEEDGKTDGQRIHAGVSERQAS